MHTPRIPGPSLAILALLMLAAFAAADLVTLQAQLPASGPVQEGPAAASPVPPTEAEPSGIDSLAFGA